jgi:hypothetical protein
MAANPPDPSRFIANNPTLRALSAVILRYGDVTPEQEHLALGYLTPMLAAGVHPREAVERFEGRPMGERLLGPRRRYETTWDYEER